MSSASSFQSVLRVEANADPAAGAHVGRDEKAVGVSLHHGGLVAGRGLAPHGRLSAAMVVLGVGVHGEQLVSDAKRRFPPRLDFVCLGQGETHLA